jgi:prepilin-type N-terminal cleavage/methylation domain-containing protein
VIERLRHEESGFTLIELLVSAVILVIGVFGLVASVNTSHKLSDVSEHETVASQVADRELDFALTVPYVGVALTSLPVNGRSADDGTQWNRWLSTVVPHPSSAFTCSSASSVNNNPTLPNDERSTSCVAACAAPDAVTAHTGCPAVGRLAAVSTVSVPGGSSTIRKLKVYRYVTWVNDLACANCANPANNNGYKGDYKRVTIAVLPVLEDVSDTTGVAASQGLGGPTRPVVVSAIRNDPAFSLQNTPAAGSPCSVQGIQC